jgi:MoaA/NifB/PqqE/SkfB family radical SAM enzyme
MLSSRFKPYHVPLFAAKYAWLTLRRRPLLVNFEVTLRCNARCGFCDYWKTPAAERTNELQSFAGAARFFRPMMATFTGGEPLLRRDLEDLVSAVHRSTPLTYLALLTHGGLLTVERARALWKAGISQFSLSLDYLDGRHDTARGIPGLTAKLISTVTAMRGSGIDAIRFNTVIKNDNLDQLMPILSLAAELGCGVNFSVYTDFKNGNREFLLQNGHVRAASMLLEKILAFKHARPGVITNSDHYLEQIPRYLRGELTKPCRSGIRTVHIDPSGRVKRCPDFPTDFHWTKFREYAPVKCNRCFYACRGEAEAPLRWSRVRDVMASAAR